MKHIPLSLAVVCVMTAAPAVAGVHPPEVEQRLSIAVGDWTIEGMEGAYRETCDWYPGRSFVVCNTVEREKGQESRSVSILGWSAQDRTYTYHHYGDSGRSRSERGFPSEAGGLVYLGERNGPDGLTQTRSTLDPLPGGAKGAMFRQERSINGGAWKQSVTLKYVPYRK